MTKEEAIDTAVWIIYASIFCMAWCALIDVKDYICRLLDLRERERDIVRRSDRLAEEEASLKVRYQYLSQDEACLEQRYKNLSKAEFERKAVRYPQTWV
jgi:hypothetical protein